MKQRSPAARRETRRRIAEVEVTAETKPVKPRVLKKEQRTLPPAGKIMSVRAMAKLVSALPITKSKYKAMKTVSPEDWRQSIQEACKTAFARLMLTSDTSVRDTILERIENGAEVDNKPAWAPRCFLVVRDNPESTSPFQLQVTGPMSTM